MESQESQEEAEVSASLIKVSAPTLAESEPLTLESLLIEDSSPGWWGDHDDRVKYDAVRALKIEPLSDKVIGLREWGTSRTFVLRAPLHARESVTTEVAASRSTHSDLTTNADNVEIAFENQSWRIKDWSGRSSLKQDGRSTREASLMSGTEITIAGRTFIAESSRSIALRYFCSRLLGWGDDRIAIVDHALRAIRLAAAGRAPLVLTGGGDLVSIAHAIHRYSLGPSVPFIVSDPRRKNTSATVRSPANWMSCVEALRHAQGGTLCVRAWRLPRDFGESMRALRNLEYSAQLMICSRETLLPHAAQIEIPSLDSRRSDLPRIISEYLEDAIHALHAADDCVTSQDVEQILQHAEFGGELTISGIECWFSADVDP